MSCHNGYAFSRGPIHVFSFFDSWEGLTAASWSLMLLTSVDGRVFGARILDQMRK